MLQLNKPGALLQATENTVYYAVPSDKAVDGYLYHNSFWLESPHLIPVSIQEIPIQSLRDKMFPNSPIQLDWLMADKPSFESDFLQIQNKIKSAGWKKAVPMVFDTAVPKEGLFKHSLSYLLQASGSGYMYAFWNEQTWFLGLSPETLYEWNGSEITSVAVAGTAHALNKIELLDTDKERIEHQYVIDGISEILSLMGEVQISNTEKYQVGPLQHLKTSITTACHYLPKNAELIENLHPTPALGAYPLVHRRDDLKNLLTPRPKLAFGSPFGLITDRWHKIIVAIRNLQMLDNELYLAAGCGIVADSVLEQEWLELTSKRKAIKQRLGIL